MKNAPLFFFGLLAAICFSWLGLAVGSEAQLGRLAPYYDDTESESYPAPFPGEAARGQLVYRSLNCAACHTQQVRRPGFGSDQARGWGDRQSVARDYIYQSWPQIGDSRNGPDLANLGGRKPTAPDAGDLLNLLYSGQGAMPSYRFLFSRQKIVGQPSQDALSLVGRLEPPAGYEVVPSQDAKDLAAYLLSLHSDYDYPEAKPAPAPKGEAAR